MTPESFRFAFCALVMSGVSLTGCQTFRRGYGHYPDGTVAAPVGTYANQWHMTQAVRADQNQNVLYEAAWIDGSDRLGPSAIKRLANYANGVDGSGCAILLEPNVNPELNERRRQRVAELLGSYGLDTPADSIQFATSDTNVLFGEESSNVSHAIMTGTPRNPPNQNPFGSSPFGSFGTGLQGGIPRSFNPGYAPY